MQLLPAYAVALVPAAAVTAGMVLIVEMLFRIGVKEGEEAMLRIFGAHYSSTSPLLWGVAIALLVVGFLGCRLTWPVVANAWTRASGAGAAP